MANYFRITGYIPEKDLSFIMDSYGAYEKLWQFSSALIQKNCKIIEVGSDEKFLDGNIEKLDTEEPKMILRATCKGQPLKVDYKVDGKLYDALQVGNKIYIPDCNQ